MPDGITLAPGAARTATSPTVTTPAGSGVVPVTVTTPGGVPVTVFTAGGSADGLTYTYVSPSTVTGVSPDTGPTSGGTVVTVTGTGLSTTDQVTFNGVPAPFEIVSDTTVTTTSPPSGTPGTFAVTVTGPGGTPSGSFTYVSGPDI
ncbi:IPT/TIG domain-containing protein [Streptomyces sp. NRRL S-1813]|uniref:IPT/TIG domain-containing protein n=1 Tax=Streptomyces sp. NRRL S-1813 TaxID=1463888 RepID=UPI001F358372|nr:IPT/TIG domain-containing protein [Streptomyces sp. NRRL S-1813]